MNNSPISYNDPSGHGRDCGLGMGCVRDPETGSLPPEIDPPVGNGGGIDDEDDPTTMLFCGSNIHAGIESMGPVCDPNAPLDPSDPLSSFYSLETWRGYDLYMRYPGSKYGMAISALALNTDLSTPVALTCYSAGTEACLMFADMWTERGGTVQSMVLIGPTFVANNRDGVLKEHDYWFGQLKGVVQDGTRTLIYDDSSILPSNVQNYQPSTGSYQVVPRDDINHNNIGLFSHIGEAILNWHHSTTSYPSDGP